MPDEQQEAARFAAWAFTLMALFLAGVSFDIGPDPFLGHLAAVSFVLVLFPSTWAPSSSRARLLGRRVFLPLVVAFPLIGWLLDLLVEVWP